MKLGKLILTAILGLSSTFAFANWQPYVDIYGGISGGTFYDNVDNPFIYANYGYNSRAFATTNKGPYHFSSNVTSGIPGLRLGIANQYNKFYLGFDTNVYYDKNVYTTSAINEYDASTVDRINFTYSNIVNATLNWHFALESQLGYFVTPKLMPYARLGLAGARATTNYSMTDLNTGNNVFNANNHSWLFGPEFGIGAQYSLNKHLRTFAEVDYTYLISSGNVTSNTTQTRHSDGVINYTFNQDLDFAAWTGVAGLGFYF